MPFRFLNMVRIVALAMPEVQGQRCNTATSSKCRLQGN